MPREKSVTIQDIAQKAKVSKSTVSRVLNDSSPVAPEKELAVLAAIEELDYRPNILARGLAGGQSMTVGVLTQDAGSPFYDAIVSGIVSGLGGTDFSPIFADGRWDPVLEEQALRTLLGRRVDGIIVVGGSLPADRLRQVADQIPVVVAAREIPALADRCLYIDNLEAGYEATRFLLAAGHRRIAHIAGPNTNQDARRRRMGYERALTEAGLPLSEELIIAGNFLPQSGLLAIEALLTRGANFTAIFSGNDQMAYGARLALFRRGIRVPQDVSLIGFDDGPCSAYMAPPLTTVHQPGVEMGDAAALALLSLLKDKPVVVQQMFGARLVVRESSARVR